MRRTRDSRGWETPVNVKRVKAPETLGTTFAGICTIRGTTAVRSYRNAFPYRHGTDAFALDVFAASGGDGWRPGSLISAGVM